MIVLLSPPLIVVFTSILRAVLLYTILLKFLALMLTDLCSLLSDDATGDPNTPELRNYHRSASSNKKQLP